jgi:CBS domain-containing protein
MKIGDSMKKNVITSPASSTVRDAVLRFVQNQISMLPVVDSAGRPVGTIHLRDLLDKVLPAIVELLDDFDYVGDFGAIEDRVPDSSWLEKPVRTVMQPVETVEVKCGLVRAFSIMQKHRMLDLPVVDDEGKLVG